MERRNRKRKAWMAEIGKMQDDCTFENLNDDCMLQIFSYLNFAERSLVSRVCKRWLYISAESWKGVKSFDLSRRSWGIIPIVRVTSIPRHQSLILACHHFSSENDEFLSEIQWENFPYVGLHEFYPEDDVIFFWDLRIVRKIMNLCANSLTHLIFGLQHPSIVHCHTFYDPDFPIRIHLPTDWLTDYIPKLKNLKYITFSRDNQIRIFSLKSLKGLPRKKLRAVDIRDPLIGEQSESQWMELIEILGILPVRCLHLQSCYIKPSLLFSSIQQKEHMKYLRITFSNHISCRSVSNPMPFISQLVNLEELELREIDSVTNDFLREISKCKKLRLLHVRQNIRMATNEGWSYLQYLPNLKTLMIQGSSSLGIEIFKDFPRLSHLTICRNSNLTIPVIIELLRNTRTIEVIDFWNTMISQDRLKSCAENLERQGTQTIQVQFDNKMIFEIP